MCTQKILPTNRKNYYSRPADYNATMAMYACLAKAPWCMDNLYSSSVGMCVYVHSVIQIQTEELSLGKYREARKYPQYCVHRMMGKIIFQKMCKCVCVCEGVHEMELQLASD